MSAIILNNVGKTYRHYEHVRDRFIEILTHKKRHKERTALSPINLEINHGEVVGIVGVNGAGKSTLLKLIAGTLQPSVGKVNVEGNICALLELGSGFHPEMTGRNNIFLAGAVAGMGNAQVSAMVGDIIEFSGLSKVIDEPVKTYSSGMVMRLAFSVATAIDPDILILDETLSVGDGIFAKKSFERIMGFKEAGRTILFCSHSMYQVQAICSRVLWLDNGELKLDGEPSMVLGAYADFMSNFDNDSKSYGSTSTESSGSGNEFNTTRLLNISVSVDGIKGNRLAVQSGVSNLDIIISFTSDYSSKAPTVGVVIQGPNGRPVTSCSTLGDGINVHRLDDGRGEVSVRFPALSLLKGSYWVNVHLMCDRGLYFYDRAKMVSELVVRQDSLEQGVVRLPHEWTE